MLSLLCSMKLFTHSGSVLEYSRSAQPIGKSNRGPCTYSKLLFYISFPESVLSNFFDEL